METPANQPWTSVRQRWPSGGSDPLLHWSRCGKSVCPLRETISCRQSDLLFSLWPALSTGKTITHPEC